MLEDLMNTSHSARFIVLSARKPRRNKNQEMRHVNKRFCLEHKSFFSSNVQTKITNAFKLFSFQSEKYYRSLVISKLTGVYTQSSRVQRTLLSATFLPKCRNRF